MNCEMVEYILVTRTIGSGVIAAILMLIALLPYLLGDDRKDKGDK